MISRELRNASYCSRDSCKFRSTHTHIVHTFSQTKRENIYFFVCRESKDVQIALMLRVSYFHCLLDFGHDGEGLGKVSTTT